MSLVQMARGAATVLLCIWATQNKEILCKAQSREREKGIEKII